MKINVVKAEGTKNHFLIIKENLKNKDLKRIFKKSISTTNYTRIDGFLVLSSSKKADFKMDYYNNDGSWETMCANGARCAAIYMYEQKFVNKKKMKIETGDGQHDVEILTQNLVRISMNTPKHKSRCIKISDIEGYHIDSGAEHFVVNYGGISTTKVKKIGRLIRKDKIFKPRGINVNFYEVLNNQKIKVKTYEKGIEDMVYSCGTGSLACVYHLSKTKQIVSPTTILVKGGKLEANFSKNWKKVTLSGSAKIEEKHQIEI